MTGQATMMQTMRRILVLSAVLVASAGAAARAQATINTGPAISYPYYLDLGDCCGVYNSEAQTFVAPTSTLLSFAFTDGSQLGGAQRPNLFYRFVISAWDPVARAAVGPELFSATRTLFDPVTFAFIPEVITTGVNGTLLTPGALYAAIIYAGAKTSPFIPGCETCAGVLQPGAAGNTYAQGTLYTRDPGDVLTRNQYIDRGTDLAFVAVFAPEPATWTLTATGLLALGGVARRRRRT